MKIQKPLVLASCLLLLSGLASAQTSSLCSGPLYRSADALLLNEANSKALRVAKEAASLDFINWSCKKEIEILLKEHKGTVPFHAQLMVFIDCSGKAANAKFLQSSDTELSRKLISVINGSTSNRTAKVNGLAVSAYAVVYLMNANGRLVYNPLFNNL